MQSPLWIRLGLALTLAGTGLVRGTTVPPEVRLGNDHATYAFSTARGLRLTGLHNRYTLWNAATVRDEIHDHPLRGKSAQSRPGGRDGPARPMSARL